MVQKLKKIQALSFDLDDTLWPLMPTILQADKAQWDWLAEHYPQHAGVFTRDNASTIRQRLLVDSAGSVANVSWMRLELLRRLAAMAGLSGRAAEHMATGAFEIFLKQRCKVVPFPDALEVLPRLARRFTLVAITNGNADVFATPLGPLFEFSLSPVDQPVAKPDPAIFHQALLRLALSADEVLHIGDSADHDVAGASAVGMATVLMQHEGVNPTLNGEYNNAVPPGGEHGADAAVTSLYELEKLLSHSS